MDLEGYNRYVQVMDNKIKMDKWFYMWVNHKEKLFLNYTTTQHKWQSVKKSLTIQDLNLGLWHYSVRPRSQVQILDGQ